MIQFRNVSKHYRQGTRDVAALSDLTVMVERGQFVSVTGPSGSGKSTFLHLAGGLDLPSEGEVAIDGVSTSGMDDDALTRLRRDRIGFVFQFFNLVPTLSVVENVALPRLIAGRRLRDVRARVDELLTDVGVAHRADHRPEELSGGEMQRVAIARALISEPEVLLADEPTGNLDSETGREILAILHRLAGRRTIVMVTHDPVAAASAPRQIRLRDGRLQ